MVAEGGDVPVQRPPSTEEACETERPRHVHTVAQFAARRAIDDPGRCGTQVYVLTMPTICSVHSFRGGTGKSNTAANLAAVWAGAGRRVGVVDTDIQSPGIHVIFGVDGDSVGRSLNDYLWGDAEIADTAIDVSSTMGPEAGGGSIHLIPSSTQPGEITRVLRDGYDPQVLTKGFRDLLDALELDVLLIDTHPGLGEETLLSIVVSHVVAIVMRPDQQDYEGTGIAVQVARQLDVPDLRLIVNKAPPSLDPAALRAQVESAYSAPVVAVVPHSDDLMTLASSDLFVTSHPHHEVSRLYHDMAEILLP